MSVSAALSQQFRVLGALILRETTSAFGTSQIGYLWAIITPAAGTALLAVIFTAAGRQPPFGESLGLFFALGIITLEFFTKLNSGLMTVLDANKALLNYPPVKEADVLFARAILIAAVYAMILALFSRPRGIGPRRCARASRGDRRQPSPSPFCWAFGFGMVNGVIVSLWPSWRYIETILTRPLFFISGIFYVPSYMPPGVVGWLSWNPVLHCVEWMRSAYYRNYDSTVLDKGYVAAVALLLVMLGLLGERLSRSRRSMA